MKIFTHGIRLVWLLGFVLLLGTILGAGWVFNQRASGTGAAAAKDPAEGGVIGIGYVDIPGGTTFLHPVLAGEVTHVFVADGSEVREGDLLLSLDNTSQRIKLHEAEIALLAAQQELVDARLLVKDLDHQIKGKDFELEAARASLEAARAEGRVMESGKKNDLGITTDQLAVSGRKIDAAANNVKASEEALARLKNVDVQGKINLAELQVKAKKEARDLAQYAVFKCDLYAPADGVLLRVYATPGDVLSSQSKQPAVHFCADLPRIVRVEILQEWASKVKEGQLAEIEDDTRYGAKWKGKVLQVSGQMDRRRSMIPDPFQYNDVRTLECIVSIEPGSTPILIGQRMRVTIKQGGL